MKKHEHTCFICNKMWATEWIEYKYTLFQHQKSIIVPCCDNCYKKYKNYNNHERPRDCRVVHN